MRVERTGIYYNPANMRHEFWVVNRFTGGRELVGWCDAGVPERLRKELEQKWWDALLQRCLEASTPEYAANVLT